MRIDFSFYVVAKDYDNTHGSRFVLRGKILRKQKEIGEARIIPIWPYPISLSSAACIRALSSNAFVADGSLSNVGFGSILVVDRAVGRFALHRANRRLRFQNRANGDR